MVEIYRPKKRRGIAGQRTKRTTESPKPYWPGLEIDDYDRSKADLRNGALRSSNGVRGNDIESSEERDAEDVPPTLRKRSKSKSGIETENQTGNASSPAPSLSTGSSTGESTDIRIRIRNGTNLPDNPAAEPQTPEHSDSTDNEPNSADRGKRSGKDKNKAKSKSKSKSSSSSRSRSKSKRSKSSNATALATSTSTPTSTANAKRLRESPIDRPRTRKRRRATKVIPGMSSPGSQQVLASVAAIATATPIATATENAISAAAGIEKPSDPRDIASEARSEFLPNDRANEPATLSSPLAAAADAHDDDAHNDAHDHAHNDAHNNDARNNDARNDARADAFVAAERGTPETDSPTFCVREESRSNPAVAETADDSAAAFKGAGADPTESQTESDRGETLPSGKRAARPDPTTAAEGGRERVRASEPAAPASRSATGERAGGFDDADSDADVDSAAVAKAAAKAAGSANTNPSEPDPGETLSARRARAEAFDAETVAIRPPAPASPTSCDGASVPETDNDPARTGTRTRTSPSTSPGETRLRIKRNAKSASAYAYASASASASSPTHQSPKAATAPRRWNRSPLARAVEAAAAAAAATAADARSRDDRSTSASASSANTNTTSNDNSLDGTHATTNNNACVPTTPRAVVRFLLRSRFPALEESLSNIRDVLLALVSGSPNLLQKRLTASESSSLASFGSPQRRTRDPSPANGHEGVVTDSNNHNHNNDNNNNHNHNHNKNDTPDHTGSSKWRQQQMQQHHHPGDHAQKPLDTGTSGFEDLCRRHERLLDRIERLEAAAVEREEALARREERWRRQFPEPQSQSHCQSQCRCRCSCPSPSAADADLLRGLERENEDLRERLERADSARDAMRTALRSRLDEQFRELERRELLVARQAGALEAARAETRALRKQLAAATVAAATAATRTRTRTRTSAAAAHRATIAASANTATANANNAAATAVQREPKRDSLCSLPPAASPRGSRKKQKRGKPR